MRPQLGGTAHAQIAPGRSPAALYLAAAHPQRQGNHRPLLDNRPGPGPCLLLALANPPEPILWAADPAAQFLRGKPLWCADHTSLGAPRSEKVSTDQLDPDLGRHQAARLALPAVRTSLVQGLGASSAFPLSWSAGLKYHPGWM
jgi:hypothetical protein